MPSRTRTTPRAVPGITSRIALSSAACLSLALGAVTLSGGLFPTSDEARSQALEQVTSQVNASVSTSTDDTGWG
ncbi:hypothetical protein OG785_23360 [Streptomyces sp. NBC_00006]|uniref:hypothetical protein n=1 Tax=Streptomyces sp. NBC_00006 TaxID=2975619 RepID=UPI00225C406C|nr:hypothetical protein [Streptomyces sp. NBC_00006]MCX5533480.1 hypothetical protein [Streptomyces sp. NBC_00006]